MQVQGMYLDPVCGVLQRRMDDAGPRYNGQKSTLILPSCQTAPPGMTSITSMPYSEQPNIIVLAHIHMDQHTTPGFKTDGRQTQRHRQAVRHCFKKTLWPWSCFCNFMPTPEQEYLLNFSCIVVLAPTSSLIAIALTLGFV